MDLLRDQDVDSLTSLEERIRRAVELVAQLREEKQAMAAERDAAVSDRDRALREASDARNQMARVGEELEALRAERTQVRTRIEKLLSQMDLLSA
jgi:hypothetical protein